MHDIIPLPQDYNVQLNFQFLQRSPKELLHTVEDSSVFKLFRINRRKILVKITVVDRVYKAEYPDNEPDATERLQIIQYIREWFDLDNELTEFYKLASADPLLRALVEKYYGYRIVGQPDLFEALTWAVIGQQINVSFAYTLKQRFVENFGDKRKWNNKIYYLFPRPTLVSALTDDDLLPLQFSRQKSKYVRLIAEAFSNNEISKASIALLPFQEAKERLMKIKGVGNWTANYALMKSFRYKDAFPLEDAGVHNAIKNLKGLKEKPTLDQVKKIFKKYKGWEAYATLYLWKSL